MNIIVLSGVGVVVLLIGLAFFFFYTRRHQNILIVKQERYLYKNSEKNFGLFIVEYKKRYEKYAHVRNIILDTTGKPYWLDSKKQLNHSELHIFVSELENHEQELKEYEAFSLEENEELDYGGLLEVCNMPEKESLH